MQLIDIDVNSLKSCSDSSKYIALTRYEKLSQTMSLMTNKSCVHVIVFSNGPMSDSNDYTVVLQQKFGEIYLSLVKKVVYKFINH